MATTATQDIQDLVRQYSTKWLEPKESPIGIFDTVGRGAKLSKTGTFDWWERLRRPRTGEVKTGGYTAGGTLPVANVTPFFVNAVIKMGTGVYRVLSIASDVLTIELISGTDASQVAGVSIKVVTNANVEGGTGTANDRNPEQKRTNTTQIMYDVFSMSVSAFESDQEVGGKEYQKQFADKMAQFRNDTRGMLWNDFYLEATTKGDLAVAGGIPYYVDANGYVPTAAALNANNLSEFVRHIYDEVGGMPKELWMNPVDRQTISSTFDSGFFRRDADSTKRGVVAETFMTTNGIEMSIMTDNNIEQGEIYALNSSDVDIRTFRDIKVEQLAKTGDKLDFEVVAEISLEVNPSAQMGKFTIS